MKNILKWFTSNDDSDDSETIDYPKKKPNFLGEKVYLNSILPFNQEFWNLQYNKLQLKIPDWLKLPKHDSFKAVLANTKLMFGLGYKALKKENLTLLDLACSGFNIADIEQNVDTGSPSILLKSLVNIIDNLYNAEMGTELVKGTLSAISPEVNNREVTTRVRFNQSDISNIRQNQRLSGRILLENRSDVLMVKRGAFMNAGGYVAYKLNGERAERIEINTGVTSINHVEVLSGLAQGDEIVISNYDTFKNADAILLR